MAPMVALIIALIIPKPRWIPIRAIQPVADKGTDNSDCHVTDDAKAGSLHNLTGQPPSSKTDQ
jgi:hypothetical protein